MVGIKIITKKDTLIFTLEIIFAASLACLIMYWANHDRFILFHLGIMILQLVLFFMYLHMTLCPVVKILEKIRMASDEKMIKGFLTKAKSDDIFILWTKI